MKRLAMLFFAVAILCMTSAAFALTFTPTDPDLMDLDHYKAYAWVLRPVLSPGEVITSATLNITGIYDWAAESGDRLYIGLIDADGMNKGGGNDYGTTTNFFRQYTDNQASGNFFAGFAGYQSIVPGGYYTDLNGGLPKENLTYSISLAALASVFNSTDAVFGIAFDPDCHYYNDKIELVLTTTKTSVPEPGMFVLFGSGLIGLGFFKRRIK